jgi:hypothetical protein
LEFAEYLDYPFVFPLLMQSGLPGGNDNPIVFMMRFHFLLFHFSLLSLCSLRLKLLILIFFCLFHIITSPSERPWLLAVLLAGEGETV